MTYIKLLKHYDNYDLPLGSIYKVEHVGVKDVYTKETGFIPHEYIKILDIREYFRIETLNDLPKEFIISGVIDLQNEIVKLKEHLRFEEGKEKRFEKSHQDAINRYDKITDLIDQINEIIEE